MLGIPGQGMEAVPPVTGKAGIQPGSLWGKVWDGPSSASGGSAGWDISIWHPAFLPEFCSMKWPWKWKLLCLWSAGSMIPEVHNLINRKQQVTGRSASELSASYVFGLLKGLTCGVWSPEAELWLWFLFISELPGFLFSCTQSAFERTGRVGRFVLIWFLSHLLKMSLEVFKAGLALNNVH